MTNQPTNHTIPYHDLYRFLTGIVLGFYIGIDDSERWLIYGFIPYLISYGVRREWAFCLGRSSAYCYIVIYDVLSSVDANEQLASLYFRATTIPFFLDANALVNTHANLSATFQFQRPNP